MTFASSFGRTFSPTFQPSSQAAVASSWWLSGSINSANCIIAYQPKGASSYATSLTNLANPGTYDAFAGAAPDWDATNGWEFDGTQYLKTGFQHTIGNYYSAIAKFSNGPGTLPGGNLSVLLGGRNALTNSRLYLADRYYASGAKHAYGWSGNTIAFSDYLKSGVVCIAAGKSYLNGSEEGSGTTSTLAATGRTVYIGSQNTGNDTTGDTPAYYFTGYIQAVAIYDIALTSTQVSALTTAMNAL